MSRKKTIKKRGSHTHGHGAKKKHRGLGSKGGKGFTGSKAQKKSWIQKYHPGHIGKKGFKSPKTKRPGLKTKSINLRDVEKLAQGKKEINLQKLGYGKVLGTGQLKRPLVVKAKSFSASAKEKIEAAKGKAEKLE